MSIDESGIFLEIPEGLGKYMSDYYLEMEKLQNQALKELIMGCQDENDSCCMAKHFQKAKEDTQTLQGIRSQVIDNILETFHIMEILIERDDLHGHIYQFCRRSLEHGFEFLEEDKRDREFQKMTKDKDC